MFSFLNSFVLPALVAIAIPIIIHFFNRRKTKKIQFSSLRFLKMLENQRIRQVRLLQILLILIRTLFLLFIVLAFARTTLKSALMDSTSARTTAVIILDDSYSMQRFNGSIPKFQTVLSQMAEILNTFTPEDRVFIIPFSDVQSNLSPINLSLSPQDLNKKYRFTNSSPDISIVFETANIIFEDHPNYNRELYLLSDLNINQSCLPDSTETILSNRKVICYLVDMKKNDQNNIGIDTVIVDNQLFEVNKPVRFSIQLKNYHIKEETETLVNLYMGTKRLAMQHVNINPTEMKSVNLSFVPKTTGPVLLHFETDDDDLIIDNRYYLNFTIPKEIKILFVNDQPTFALQTALNVINSNSIVKIDQFNYGQWIGKNLDIYDLIVLYNPPGLNAESINRLDRYLQNKNLIIIPGFNLSVRDFNMIFSRLANNNMLINLITSPGTDTYFTLDANIRNLSLFESIFSKEDSPIGLPKIFKYFKLINSSKSILRLQNNDVLLAEYETISKNKVFVFSSLLENGWSDFAYKGFFIPMLYRILFTASQNSLLERTYQVDDNIAFSLPDLSLSNPYTIQGPKSEAHKIIPQQFNQGLQITLDKVQEPGHYIIQKNGQFEYAFSVNISSNELKRPYVNFENLSDNVIMLDGDDDMSKTILSARIGQELWFSFLSLALLMLLIEVLLIKKIERQGLK